MKSKKTYTLDELISLLEVEVEQTGSRKEAAAKLSVSAQYLGDVLNRKREPGKKILDALRLRKITRYEEGE